MGAKRPESLIGLKWGNKKIRQSYNFQQFTIFRFVVITFLNFEGKEPDAVHTLLFPPKFVQWGRGLKKGQSDLTWCLNVWGGRRWIPSPLEIEH